MGYYARRAGRDAFRNLYLKVVLEEEISIYNNFQVSSDGRTTYLLTYFHVATPGDC